MGEVKWDLIGQHNVHNAPPAIAAAHHADVSLSKACEALGTFRNVKRRLELRGVVNDVSVYDDFAHHPTAIAATIEALRQKVGQQKIIAVVEPRSNTMRMGIHKNTLASALKGADVVVFYQPEALNWSLVQVAKSLQNALIFYQTEALIQHVVASAGSNDHILIMSNGSFENIHDRLLTALA
ncbi:UDP-N-acetylmuramate:L-alanyl-gamma-D-glutamyl- meso-diaminopimelate ligase [Candidatus Thiomargarita nelsonii]|uniref:UDP-N-acetylmuramate:L-alanyl-gamma-D-glutamyl-meso-diaminopimelate ligase n=1 Tax=Candidatus Thiomargarita nelsonii TaxID=1003181 RepID=A0A176S435_9GAMM|nr:UDP-N-acetylmuramate:L-alanyl-gamma-D-glutamyl- meso-diaminopimelate ligase [Candidatus Thiomargarita nelsonii]